MDDRQLKLYEKNCVNIGYNMCKAESITVLRDMIVDCESKEELELLRKVKDSILKLECCWDRQDSQKKSSCLALA